MSQTMTNDQWNTEMQNLWDIPSFEESNKEFERIEEGSYILRLVEIGEPEKLLEKYDPSQKKRRAKFSFEVVSDIFGDQTWAGYALNTWYTLTMHEGGNLYPVAKALLGGKLNEQMRIQPSMLVGKTMQATIINGKPNEKGDVWPQITAPVAVRNRLQNTVQAAAETFDAEVEGTTVTDDEVPF